MDPLNPYPGNLKKHEVTSDPRAPYGKPNDDQLGMILDITTHDEAEELLKKYTAEEIRQLWESGAFGDRPEAVKNYLFTRIIHGDLESSEE